MFRTAIAIASSLLTCTAAFAGDNDILSALRGDGLLPYARDSSYDVPATSSGNRSVISQTGARQQATSYQHGVDNNVIIYQQGTANRASTIQYGSNNSASIQQSGDCNTATVKQVGRNNYVDIVQSSGGQYLAITQAGTGLSAVISPRR